jgi:hypothetical protein
VNGAETNNANQQIVLANQDASPASGVRWVAGIIAIPGTVGPMIRRVQAGSGISCNEVAS